MKSKVTVIDYGLGNLFSVKRALEYCGAEHVVVSSDPDEIRDASHVVLPGVGAFCDGMRGLINRGMVEPIYSYVETGRPFLGICLGMQLLVTRSEEFGLWDGLNIIPGKVVEMKKNNTDGSPRKIPKIGWSSLAKKNNSTTDSILNEIDDADSVYLVHSYEVITKNSENILCTYNFGGAEVTAGITFKNTIGLQFHPEKSGKSGLKILKSFLQLV